MVFICERLSWLIGALYLSAAVNTVPYILWLKFKSVALLIFIV